MDPAFSRWYMPGTSQRGGPHSVWVPPSCEVPGIYHLDPMISIIFSFLKLSTHKGFFFFLGDQSFKPLHFIDLDNVIHTLKVLPLLLCKCFLCVCVNSEFSVFLCILNLYLICEQFNLNDEKVGQRGGT